MVKKRFRTLSLDTGVGHESESGQPPNSASLTESFKRIRVDNEVRDQTNTDCAAETICLANGQHVFPMNLVLNKLHRERQERNPKLKEMEYELAKGLQGP